MLRNDGTKCTYISPCTSSYVEWKFMQDPYKKQIFISRLITDYYVNLSDCSLDICGIDLRKHVVRFRK